jgi:hypothetical protein
MNIVQRAIMAVVGPAIASAQTALVARIDALEARPALTDADRAAIAQAADLAAKFAELAGEPASESPTLDGDVVMVTDVP